MRITNYDGTVQLTVEYVDWEFFADLPYHPNTAYGVHEGECDCPKPLQTCREHWNETGWPQ